MELLQFIKMLERIQSDRTKYMLFFMQSTVTAIDSIVTIQTVLS